MNITYCTYYDHIIRGGYYPELVVENWNNCTKRLITCANGQYDVLRDMKLDAEIIGIGIDINIPSDIPRAFNRTLDIGFDLGADVVVFIHGDMYLTDRGDEHLFRMINNNPNPLGSMYGMGVQLYAWQYNHPFQLTISSRDPERRAIVDPKGDGENMIRGGGSWTEDITMLLDIGYYNSFQYYTRLKSHVNVWGHEGWKDEVIKLYESGEKRQAIARAYKEIRAWARKPLEPANMEPYRNLMDRFDLWEDHKFCLDILKDYLI